MLTDYKIVLATGNAHKAAEIEKLFAFYTGKQIKIYTLKDIGFTGDIDETGTTFAENAMIKASAIAGDGMVVLADDSGLCVEALNGEPGIRSARYAGTGKDSDNNALLLKNLEGQPVRLAFFACSVACIFPKDAGIDPFTVEGYCSGEILLSERGKGGFGYDPLFWIDELGKTMAELTMEEKNLVSHRGTAVLNLIRKLKTLGQI